MQLSKVFSEIEIQPILIAVIRTAYANAFQTASIGHFRYRNKPYTSVLKKP